jgi:hypothetical protein
MAATTKTETKTDTKRKTLKELFEEPCTIELSRALMHQSFHVPGAGQETTMSASRPGMRDLKLVYHLGYGVVIGYHKGEYFLTPGANTIVGHE